MSDKKTAFSLVVPARLNTLAGEAFVHQVLLAASLQGVSVETVIPEEDPQNALLEVAKKYPLPSLISNDGNVFFQSRAAIRRVLSPPEDMEDGSIVSRLEDLSLELNSQALSGQRVDEARLLEAFDTVSKLVPRSVEAINFFGLVQVLCRRGHPVPKPISAWKDAIVASVDENAFSAIGSVVMSEDLSASRNIKEGVAIGYDPTEERLPKKDARNILITAALPYVNNVPHLGNIIGAVLSADVFARYCRLRGYQTLYVCGTDEYGTATETKALEEGISCADLCAKYYKLHAAIYDWFGISTDIFGRTSTPKQTAITHEIFHGLYKNEYFFEQAVEQTYCERCSRFLADRYVEGCCPHCNYADARGDQCDGCGKLLNPTELKEPQCKICRQRPVVRSSKHLFLDLTKLQPVCEKFVDKQSAAGHWSGNSTSISKAWLTEGLKPRCMTRDLKWGTPVPVPGFEDKVFYVWFDACFGYISITANYTDQWRQWWQCNAQPEKPNVQLFQFMGKDNVPFHTVIFPSTLLGCPLEGSETPWTLLHHINTTEYLNYEQGKFSKSRSIGVFGNDARDSGIPVSVWRYYLLAVRPEATDATFSWDDFGARNNNELLANLGNFVSRVAKFTVSKFDGKVPGISSTSLGAVEEALLTKVNEEVKTYIGLMEGVHLKAALKVAMAISSLGNAYLTESGLDNRLLISDRARCGTILTVALNLAYLLSALLDPFIPSTAEDIRRILNAPLRGIPDSWELDVIRKEHALGQPFHLFSRIEESRLKELRGKFAGKQVK